MIPNGIDPNESYFANGMMNLKDPIDAYDSKKINRHSPYLSITLHK